MSFTASERTKLLDAFAVLLNSHDQVSEQKDGLIRPELCPHCGFNFTQDVPIHIGDWMLHPTETRFQGERLKLEPMEAQFLHTVAKAKGRAISAGVIGERLSDADDPRKMMHVIACKLRKKLPLVPFVTILGAGYRWAA